ncbi:hypothetical protein MLD52_18005 [Puniceicoccaceae bacterium K14]|nr:hypothetical protein [Puniceicoccaceae bacterium K14]
MTITELLQKHVDTEWQGQSELWTDPLGNDVSISECKLKFTTEALHYTWSFEDKEENGLFTFSNGQIKWHDSWHQPETVDCRKFDTKWGIIVFEYKYPASPGPDWGWRIKLSQRPDESLVIQMTNIAPWGEEGRAVRMILKKL